MTAGTRRGAAGNTVSAGGKKAGRPGASGRWPGDDGRPAADDLPALEQFADIVAETIVDHKRAEALRRIVADHQTSLQCGGEDGRKADLRGFNLERLNLSRLDLSGANLRGANLTAVRGACIGYAHSVVDYLFRWLASASRGAGAVGPPPIAVEGDTCSVCGPRATWDPGRVCPDCRQIDLPASAAPPRQLPDPEGQRRGCTERPSSPDPLKESGPSRWTYPSPAARCPRSVSMDVRPAPRPCALQRAQEELAAWGDKRRATGETSWMAAGARTGARDHSDREGGNPTAATDSVGRSCELPSPVTEARDAPVVIDMLRGRSRVPAEHRGGKADP